MENQVVVDLDVDRSWQYNNAGVQLFICNNSVSRESNSNNEALLNDALKLFRSALEAKLQYEQSKTTINSSNEYRRHEHQADYDNDIPWEGNIENIKEIQGNFDFSVLLRCVSPDNPQEMDPEEKIRMIETQSSIIPTQQATATTTMIENAINVDSSSSLPSSSLYLHGLPFELIDSTSTGASSLSLLSSSYKAQVSSAIIVFNLGLVHQLQNTYSIKASLFYEIALALIQQQEQEQVNVIPDEIRKHIWLFELALVNNFAVWNYDNDDSDNVDIIPYFVELLIDLMNSGETHHRQERQQQNHYHIEDQNVDHTHYHDNITILLEGVRANIQLLLTHIARAHDAAVTTAISASSE